MLCVLLAMSGCAGTRSIDDSFPTSACAGMGPSSRPTGEAIGDGISPRALCRSRGRPRSASRRGKTVVWDYGCGVTWQVNSGRAKLVVTDQVDPFCTPKGTSPTRPLPIVPPPDLNRSAQTRFRSGSYVAAAVGCLACHRIASNGNDGPGPDLTSVGSRLPSAAIGEVLRRPPAPMPSFAKLPKRRLEDLTFFLARLRAAP